MNRKKIVTLMLTAVLLTSCTQAPESVKSNNHKAEKVTNYKTLSSKDAWGDTDEAYKTKYKKFKLPDRSTFSHKDFDGLYDVTLTYVNNEDTDEWYEKHFPEFEKVMGISGSGKPEMIGNNRAGQKTYGYTNDNYEIIMGIFNNGDFVNLKMIQESESDFNSKSKRYILNQNEIPKGKNISDLINKAEEISLKTDSALEYETENYPAFIQAYGENTFKIYSQTYYRNVGIECVAVHSVDDDYLEDKDGNSILSSYMQNFTVFHDGKFQAYYGNFGFKTVEAKNIEKIISFKSACDILEKELSPNMKLKFDEVELWYQPKGKDIDTSQDNYGINDKNITLTPKWYFMINDKTDDHQYAVSYVTVDCQSGEVHVLLPGNN